MGPKLPYSKVATSIGITMLENNFNSNKLIGTLLKLENFLNRQ